MKHSKLLLLLIVGAMMLASCEKPGYVSRIQSITYVSRYSDGKAVMSYTNNGTITAGTATFIFELKPASTAAEVAKAWKSAVSMSAVYTDFRHIRIRKSLTVESVTAYNGCLIVIVNGSNLNDDYFLNKCSANVRLCISDGNNDLTSEYIKMEPHVQMDEKFNAYCVENFDIDGDGEISEDEAKAVKEIDCSNMGLTSLVGIEYFTNLKSLNCSGNNLTTLDVSKNTSLTTLDVSNNTSLAKLDVSKNTSLTSLNISGDNSLITLKYTDGVKVINDFIIGRYINVNGVGGVVFSASETATKIMSIDETEAKWGYYDSTTGATDRDDGVANTNKIVTVSPAAQWCRAKGSAWYLPARKELDVEIYDKRATLNSTLDSISGTSLKNDSYWSSTEYSYNCAVEVVYSSSGTPYPAYKSVSNRVRAVRAL